MGSAWSLVDPGPGLILVLDLDEVQGVSLVKQERSEHWMHLAVSPMLTQDVSWVDVATNMMEGNHLGGYAFACVVMRECMVTFG